MKLRTTVALLVGVLACGGAQCVLWEGTSECLPVPKRIESVRERYSAFLEENGQDFADAAWAHLSIIPDAYLDWVFKKHGAKVRLVSEDYSPALSPADNAKSLPKRYLLRAQTTLRGDRPIRVWLKAPLVRQGQGTFFGLIHEVGHMVDGFLMGESEVRGAYERSADELFENRASNKNTRREKKISVYSGSIVQEYVAEMFDSYYCSPSTRAYLKNELPPEWDFATSYFLPPSNLTPEEASALQLDPK